jgi:hypothetical protein
VNFDKGDRKSNRVAAGIASILLGIMTLTIQFTMSSTHTWDGVNYANAFNMLMTTSGIGLLLLGTRILAGRIRVLNPILRPKSEVYKS